MAYIIRYIESGEFDRVETLPVDTVEKYEVVGTDDDETEGE